MSQYEDFIGYHRCSQQYLVFGKRCLNLRSQNYCDYVRFPGPVVDTRENFVLNLEQRRHDLTLINTKRAYAQVQDTSGKQLCKGVSGCA